MPEQPASAPLPADDVREACLLTLGDLGYERRAEPLRIVNLEFDFEAVFVGPDGHHSLVLVVEVADMDAGALDTLRRRLDRLSLALTRVDSLRPVTLVLVTDEISSRALDALRPLARVVVVERRDQSRDSVRAALREFSPLDPGISTPSEAAGHALARNLGALADDPDIQSLRRAAQKGTAEVEAVFADLLIDAIAGPSADPS